MSGSASAHRELLSELTRSVLELRSSAAWAQWLSTCARFHRYSFHNQLLIARQRPEATWVAGFGTWLSLGRHVLRGERGIRILAPCTARTPTEEDLGEAKVRLLGFRIAHVFDIDQTAGRELPSPARPLSGALGPTDRGPLIARALQLGFRIEFVDLRGQRNGDCSHALHRIRIRTGLSPDQQFKTMVHELGHAMLHGHEFAGSRQLAELEAESLAYVVCRGLGVDSSEYSVGYLASWAGDDQTALRSISASAARIGTAADSLLSDYSG